MFDDIIGNSNSIISLLNTFLNAHWDGVEYDKVLLKVPWNISYKIYSLLSNNLIFNKSGKFIVEIIDDIIIAYIDTKYSNTQDFMLKTESDIGQIFYNAVKPYITRRI
jgi:hypothetical protein